MIAISAEGRMRDAESLLSQVMSLENKKITAKEVEEILGTSQRQSLEKLVGYILDKNSIESIGLINSLSQEGYDLDVFNKSLLNYLRQLMLVIVDEKLSKLFSFELTKEQVAHLIKQSEDQDPEKLLFIIQCFMEIQGKIKSSFIPQLPLEMAIVKAIGFGYKNENVHDKDQIKNIPSIRKIASRDSESDNAQSDINTSASSLKNDKNYSISKNSDLTIEDINKYWKQFVEEIKPINHSLSAILQSCHPFKAEKGTVSIAARFPFHKDKLNDNDNRLTMESVFAKILGFHLCIKAFTTQEAGIKNKEVAKEEKKPRKTSSLLTQALDMMGGTVIE